MFKQTMLLCILSFAVVCTGQQTKEKTPDFSTTEEIQLVLTQAERAFGDYEQAVAMEAQLPTSRRNPSMVAKDREVYDNATKLIATLKMHPESFHGLGGFLLLSSLDDASRNAALCSGSGYSDTVEAFMANSDVSSGKDWIHTGLTCINVSGFLYTVSESVQALLVRDLEAQQMLNQAAKETMEKCTAALKKCAAQAR